MNNYQKPDILLFEDSAYDAELIMRAINKSNFNLNALNLKDGAEGLEFLQSLYDSGLEASSRLPRLILLDLKMPKVNGLEILQELKKNELTLTIPVVVFSSSQESQDVIRSYQLGANSYVTKPVDYENFIATINSILQYWLSINQTPLLKGI